MYTALRPYSYGNDGSVSVWYRCAASTSGTLWQNGKHTPVHESWDMERTKVFTSTCHPWGAFDWSNKRTFAFHAVTGCDSISQFGGHGKKTAWQVFQKHHMDLDDLGKGYPTENTVVSAEKFICKMYGIPEVDTCNKARVKLFCLGRAQDNLPPTSDAAKFHIMRSHYQPSVWNQAHLQHPDLPPVTKMGWMQSEVQLVPRLLSLPPIPRLTRRSPPVVVQKVASANAAAAWKFVWNV